MEDKGYVWFDGKLVRSADAKVHILTHSLQYGSGIFEGIRAYKAKSGTALFRLKDHIERFVSTSRIYRMELGYTKKQLADAVVETVRKNGIESGYIRPFAFYNDTRIGLSVSGKKVSVAIAAVPFGSYFSGKVKGIQCKVSSWKRINSEIMPPHAKASGNYRNSILASEEAKESGADEAIMLSGNGFVAEGPGENLFMVKDSKLVTPSPSADILMGITRDSIIKIAEGLGIAVQERGVHREELYTADELFFSGTAAEVTPIVGVDKRQVGSGKTGPVTKLISERFSMIATGNQEGFNDWLTYV